MFQYFLMIYMTVGMIAAVSCVVALFRQTSQKKFADCQHHEQAAKIAQRLADDRLDVIRTLQEKLQDVENEICDRIEPVVDHALDQRRARRNPQSNSGRGIPVASDDGHRDAICAGVPFDDIPKSNRGSQTVAVGTCAAIERTILLAESEYRPAFRFQDPFRGRCGPTTTHDSQASPEPSQP